MRSGYAVEVKGVSKNFKLPHKQVRSVKGMFTGIFSRNKSGAYEVQHALRDVSFSVKKGEFFGIVGRNGSGKSTLLKIIAQIYQPTHGSVNIDGKIIPFIELGVGFNEELTGRENVYLNGALLGYSEKEVDAKYDEIVSFAELERFMDQKLKNYSSGMKVRLAFSTVVNMARSDILLIDEVLAVGDADFQRKCFDYFRQLKKDKKTVIFVSHDMNAVSSYCDRAVLIDDSRVLQSGDALKISQEYSKLFLEQDKSGQKDGSEGEQRWGDGAVRYSKLKVHKDSNKGLISVSAEVVAHEAVDDAVFGFLVRSPDGKELMGTNTQIIGNKPLKIDKSQAVKIEWSFPDIFSEGTYYVEPAIVYNGGGNTADWWQEAASFNVKKQHNTHYVVTPDIDAKISVIQQ